MDNTIGTGTILMGSSDKGETYNILFNYVSVAHESSSVMPWMSEGEIDDLAESIRKHGLLEPIVLHPDGSVLDGRHRLVACKRVGVEPKYVTWKGEPGTEMRYVVERNLRRRHLTAAERALIATKLITTTQSGPKKPGQVSVEEAAKLMQVGKSSVVTAKGLIDTSATKELIEAVKKGKLSLKKAKELAKGLTPEQQKKALGSGLLESFTGKSTAEVFDQPIKTKNRTFVALSEWDAMEPMTQVDLIDANLNQEVVSGDLAALIQKTKAGEKAAAATKMLQFVESAYPPAQWQWNPITGCLGPCTYCYARQTTTKLFPAKFEPTLWLSKLDTPFYHKEGGGAQMVYVGDLADMWAPWVPTLWTSVIMAIMRATPQFTYITTTKYPAEYEQRLQWDSVPDNVWLGVTIDGQYGVKEAEEFLGVRTDIKHRWLCIEPVLTPIVFYKMALKGVSWAYIGGARRIVDVQNSQLTPTFAPPMEWLVQLHNQLKAYGVPIWHSEHCGLSVQTREKAHPLNLNATGPSAAPIECFSL